MAPVPAWAIVAAAAPEVPEPAVDTPRFARPLVLRFPSLLFAGVLSLSLLLFSFFFFVYVHFILLLFVFLSCLLVESCSFVVRLLQFCRSPITAIISSSVPPLYQRLSVSTRSIPFLLLSVPISALSLLLYRFYPSGKLAIGTSFSLFSVVEGETISSSLFCVLRRDNWIAFSLSERCDFKAVRTIHLPPPPSTPFVFVCFIVLRVPRYFALSRVSLSVYFFFFFNTGLAIKKRNTKKAIGSVRK